jgi:hydrogenase expression/formation protein HypD
LDRRAITELVGRITAAAAAVDRAAPSSSDGAARRGEVRLMEVCGTHTVSLFRSGLKSLLPGNVRLISGPGCPVCVTTQGYLDTACELAARPEVTICTYGDMVRVPGRRGSLERMRAGGARVKVVYSAREALRTAQEEPGRETVFLAVGFETTAPATAAVLMEATEKGVGNLSVLVGHKLIVPALDAILSAGDVAIDGFLLPGHVSVIIGADAYRPVVDTYGKPCVVAGFEPVAMLRAILELVLSVNEQAAGARAKLGNAYGEAVTGAGNVVAQRLIGEVFRPAPADWRAMGTIPESGLALRGRYERFDALGRFGVEIGPDFEPEGCRCGEVIQGKARPTECGLFGAACTPADPVGPCMVSSEGSCAAWYKYGGVGRARAAVRDDGGDSRHG